MCPIQNNLIRSAENRLVAQKNKTISACVEGISVSVKISGPFHLVSTSVHSGKSYKGSGTSFPFSAFVIPCLRDFSTRLVYLSAYFLIRDWATRLFLLWQIWNSIIHRKWFQVILSSIINVCKNCFKSNILDGTKIFENLDWYRWQIP